MKKVLIILFLWSYQNVVGQPCTAVITPGGSTTFCQGNNVTLTANIPNTWAKVKPYGGVARYLGAGFTIAGKIYMGTGFDGGNYLVDFWEFDPITNVWTQRADFAGGAREWAVGFSIGNKGYIGTGYNDASLNDFWEYDTLANNWTIKAPLPGAARFSAIGFSIGNKGYIGTGYDHSTTYKDFWEYDPSNTPLGTWTRKADVGDTARDQAFGFSIGNKGYVGTGTFAGSGNFYKDFWEFDAATDSWTRKADFGGGKRVGAAAFSIGGKGFAGIGQDSIYNRANDFWEYDPATDSWIAKANFGGAGRYYSTAFNVNDKGYIGTGFDGNAVTDFWEYTPDDALTYLWSNGRKTLSIKVAVSGSYTVTVNNATLGCSATSLPIVVNVIGPLTSAYTKTDATCNSTATGSITITPTFGVSPFTYRIGTVAGYVPSNTFNNLRAGSYRVSILDANGCAGVSDQVIITQPVAITGTSGVTNATCYGVQNGSITVTPTTGTTPHTYRLGSTGSFVSSNVFNNVRAGAYRLFIQDANSCVGSIVVTLTQPTKVSGTATKNDETCPGARNGSITVTGAGGTPPYTYRFGSTGAYTATNTFNNLKAGSYRVYVNDANGCSGYSILVTVGQTSGSCFTARAVLPEIQPSNSNLKVSITPNPSSRQFTLQVNSTRKESVQIRVMDVNGRTVHTIKGISEKIYRFGEQFAPGLYMIEVRQGEEVKTLKAVKS